MLPDPGANDGLAASDLPGDLFRPGGVLHVTGYALLRPGSRAAARAALERARAAGMRTSLDPSSAAPLAAGPDLLELAGPVDLLLPNEAEAPLLGPAPGELVITRGAAGATWTDGTRTVAVPARPAAVRDTPAPGTRSRPGSWPPGTGVRTPRSRPAPRWRPGR
jgi:sugar/nucleoside kinase (ribokinase family)